MLNCFLGVGRIGRDAELTSTRDGEAMARFSIAVERNHRKGQVVEPDWFPCLLFGDRARTLAPYLTKGTLIGVRGRVGHYRISGSPGSSHDVFRIHVHEVNFLRRPLAQEEAWRQPPGSS